MRAQRSVSSALFESARRFGQQVLRFPPSCANARRQIMLSAARLMRKRPSEKVGKVRLCGAHIVNGRQVVEISEIIENNF